ncbi:choice-of-anchor L domain-containing protein, partial [Mesonia sp.]|uniref:choice-of-anchor L domain-containing protein n=1 Tax=Mesonia sp. TaxID=1960830 RepID=UPI0017568682
MKRKLPLILVFLFSFSSLLAQDILISDGSIDQCTGNFYDTGGAAADYGANENLTFTICPDADGQYVGLEFNDFDLADGSTMTIYNGDTVVASQEFGEFTGTDSPDEIKATAEAASGLGCLTIVFESGDDTALGWEAEITCNDPDVYANDYQTTNVYYQCSGNFYDNGGPSVTYSSEGGGDQVFTFCPDDPDLVTEIDFEYFVPSFTGDDKMLIYDGDSTSAPLIDEYTNNPGYIMASPTNPSGCITVVWSPDGVFSPAPGWEATIGCREPCQLIESIITLDPVVVDLGNNNYEIAVNEQIDFTSETTFANSGEDATFEWDFGDGGSVNGENVSHTYTNQGTFDGSLTITDNTGCELVVEFTVTVNFYAVVVDDTTYTVPELVEDVLINNDCAQISNITWRSGNTIGTDAGIGYFNKNNSSFPMEEGVVLYSGNVNDVPGPETGTQSSGGWNGDADLDDLIDQIEGAGGPSSNDATLIEFDFLTFADQISFNFLFSSDEYGQYQCSFSDPFGFFLTDESGNTQNIALVPGTTTPVAVTTVRDNQYNGGCASVNANYFDKYYGTGGLPTNSAPINSRGVTRIMTAQSAVTPGETYHIKLVIGDRSDSAFNSTVFLEAGSFDIGTIDLGGDITQTTPEATCLGQSVTLDLDLTIIDGVTIEWFQDGELIPGENGTTLDVFEEGVYTAEFTFDPDGTGTSGCSSSDDVLVEFLPTPIIDGQAPADLFACSTGGESEIFNLLTQNEQVLNGQDAEDFVISYYESELDAEDDVNAIIDPENYEAFPECTTLYVRIEGSVEGNLAGCYAVYEFDVCVGDVNVGDQIEDLYGADPDGDQIAIFDLTVNDEEARGDLLEEEYSVSYFETQEDADANTNVIENPTAYENEDNNPQDIFVRLQGINNEECVATNGSFLVEAVSCAANAVDSFSQCGNGVDTVFFDFTANTTLALGSQTSDNYSVAYFETEQNAIDLENEITDTSNYEMISGQSEIFVRVDNGLVETCYNITSFTLTVNTVTIGDLSSINLEECDEDSNG